MVVSFVRIDDRMIHGQTVTRWAKEKPCDGLIAVNDAEASNKVLIQDYKGASDKKTFVWTKEAFKEKSAKVTESETRYFLITKNPIDMKEILVDQGFVPGDVKEIIVGPANDRPGAVKLGTTNPSPRKKQKPSKPFRLQATRGNSSCYQMYPSVTGMISNQNSDSREGSILALRH